MAVMDDAKTLFVLLFFIFLFAGKTSDFYKSGS